MIEVLEKTTTTPMGEPDRTLQLGNPSNIRVNQTEIPYVSRVERLPDMLPGAQRPKVLLDHISPSALKKYQRCPASHWFHYGEGLRESGDSGLLRGSAIHEAAHAYGHFRNKALHAGEEPPHEKLLELAREYADAYLTREYAQLEFDPGFEWKEIYKNAKRYHDHESLREFVRAAVGLMAESTWRHTPISELEAGYIIYWQDENDPDESKRTLPVLLYADRIETRIEDGSPRATVFDIKSGVRKAQGDVDLDSALTGYCIAHEVFTGILTRDVAYDMLVCNAQPLSERVASKRDLTDFKRFYRTARGLTLARRSGDFLPVDDASKCSTCDYRTRCRELYQ